MFALLQAAMLVHIEWTNIFANNSEAENLTDLRLWYQHDHLLDLKASCHQKEIVVKKV